MDFLGFSYVVGTERFFFFPMWMLLEVRKVEKKDILNVNVVQTYKEVLIFFLPVLKNALSMFCLKLVWSKDFPEPRG